jgi:hypothetical protein
MANGSTLMIGFIGKMEGRGNGRFYSNFSLISTAVFPPTFLKISVNGWSYTTKLSSTRPPFMPGDECLFDQIKGDGINIHD